MVTAISALVAVGQNFLSEQFGNELRLVHSPLVDSTYKMVYLNVNAGSNY